MPVQMDKEEHAVEMGAVLTKPTSRYLTAAEIADICYQDVVPMIENKQYRSLLVENEGFIRSILIRNDVDLFKATWMNTGPFCVFVGDCAGNDALAFAAKSMVTILQSHIVPVANEWERIGENVSHELTPFLGKLFASTASSLGQISYYKYRSRHANLFRVLNGDKATNLTLAERHYIAVMMLRATSTGLWNPLTPNNDKMRYVAA